MTVNSKMTALANEIRELSGTTTTKSLDTMTSDIDAANTEIAEQTALLEQIATALEGKTAGGSGNESNLIKFKVEEASTSFTYEFIAYEGMTWEDFCSSIFNLKECFAFGGVDPDTGAVYMSWIEPSGRPSQVYLIVKDSSGSYITNSTIQNEMIVYAMMG